MAAPSKSLATAWLDITADSMKKSEYFWFDQNEMTADYYL